MRIFRTFAPNLNTNMKENNLKMISIQLTPADWKYIQRRGRLPMVNKALVALLTQLRRIQGLSLAELNGWFTAEEWKYLADLLKDNYVGSKGELLELITNTDNLISRMTFYSIDQSDFVKRRSQINEIHVMAITDRVADYWEGKDLIDLGEWAQSLARK